MDISNVDIDNILTADKFPCKKDFRYFIAHKNDEKVTLLCILLPKMTRYK